MENKNPEQVTMDLPPYSIFPKLVSTRKKWIVGVSAVLILALIVVAGSLVGVYMTQKHTEQMVTVAFANAEGENIVQTVSVNERDEIAAVYVRSDKYSGTFLFDYKKKLIAFRKPNSTKCFVLRMEETKTPALSALLKGVEYLREHDPTANDKVTYNFEAVEEANPADVGSSVYLMCSDANIYWARNVHFRQRGAVLVAGGSIGILGLIHLAGGIEIGHC
ncbi:surfactant protein C-like [Mantella aurantiaca]